MYWDLMAKKCHHGLLVYINKCIFVAVVIRLCKEGMGEKRFFV